MATQFDNAIQQLYVAYFNRPADAGGIAFWANVLTNNGGNTAAISTAFAASAEYQTAYTQLTTAGVVTQVYQNLFGRSPEASGLAFWVKALNDKAITVDNMVTTIASAAQTTDKVAFDSKVKVATSFTNALDTPAEQAGYSGDLANVAAKALLSTIKTDAQANAAIVPATLNASIATVVKASVPFTLESGLTALDASNKAVVDFLAAAEIDLDGDDEADEDVNAADIGVNLTNAQAAVGLLVNNAAYAGAADSVKAAIVADSVAKAALDLETKQGALTTALGKLSATQATAVATSTSAAEIAKDAADARVETAATLFGATSVLTNRNPAVEVEVNGTVNLIGEDAEGDPTSTPIVVIKAGVLTLATDLKAADYPGVATYITAANAAAAAVRADVDASDAALLAQARVETLDLGTPAALVTLDNAFKVGGPVTPAKADAPTGDEIAAQLNGLKLLAVAAQEKAAAAGATQADIDAAATAATDVTQFRAAVVTFNGGNATPLATAVVDAEAAVKTSQDGYDALEDAVADLNEATALSTQLKALQDAVKVASDDFVTNKFKAPVTVGLSSNFGTSGNDIFVANKELTASTITSFGLQGDDVLYVGSGYSLNTGKLDAGNNAVLEVFFTQQGSSTVVSIETKAFGSDSGTDIHTITLTGVDATDLTFNNGIISL